MKMCCLINFHADMLTLFKRLLTMEQMSMQKVNMEKMYFAFSMWKPIMIELF